jgi:hypothetical protein
MEKTKFKPQANPLPSIDEQKKARGMPANMNCKNCRWAFKTPTGGVPQFILMCHGAPPSMQIVSTQAGPSVQLVPRGIPDEYFCKEFERLEVLDG